MRTRLFIVLIIFVVIGSYSKAQDLEPKECANGKYGFTDNTGREVIPCKSKTGRNSKSLMSRDNLKTMKS
jgi:hypothetical protein